MNTDMNNTHPFGYWITAVDRLMKAEFATVFADEGITRRDWRMLNIIDGTVSARVPSRPLRGPKLGHLVELGWIERSADDTSASGWTLTDAGRLAKTRLGTAVDELRARVAGAVTPDEYEAMTASLEKIARKFGWEEGKRLPRRHGGRGRRGGRGHGRHGFGHGFDHGHGRHGFGHEHGRHGDSEFDGHPHAHRERGHRRGHRIGPVEHHIHIHTRAS